MFKLHLMSVQAPPPLTLIGRWIHWSWKTSFWNKQPNGKNIKIKAYFGKNWFWNKNWWNKLKVKFIIRAQITITFFMNKYIFKEK